MAGNLKDITEKQFSGFYGEAGNATSWLAIRSLARPVCGHGINLCLIYQSLGQLTQGWVPTAARPGSMPLICGSSPIFRITRPPVPVQSLRRIHRPGLFGHRRFQLLQLGAQQPVSPSIDCRQQVARRLIKPEEVLHRLRYEEQIVLIQNATPLPCGRAIYFRRPEMVARVKGGVVRKKA